METQTKQKANTLYEFSLLVPRNQEAQYYISQLLKAGTDSFMISEK